jgi:hypothetical protein
MTIKCTQINKYNKSPLFISLVLLFNMSTKPLFSSHTALGVDFMGGSFRIIFSIFLPVDHNIALNRAKDSDHMPCPEDLSYFYFQQLAS